MSSLDYRRPGLLLLAFTVGRLPPPRLVVGRPALWGGFRTGDDDGRPFAQLLAQDYEKRDHRFFGRYLKLELYERRLDTTAAASKRLPDLETRGERPPRVPGAVAQQITARDSIEEEHRWFVARS